MHRQRTLTRYWVREIDRRAMAEFGMSGLVLMENAARGAADVLLSLGCRGPVAIVCGKGNNAGDGFAMARHLEIRGVPVKVLLASDPSGLEGDAAANYRILERCRLPIVPLEPLDEAVLAQELADCEWIVDALLGTGAAGNPRPPLDEIIAHLNWTTTAKKLAVDLPSGLDCDTGQPGDPTFQADHTVTFVAAKPGLLAEAARGLVGRLHVVDIGAPWVLVQEILRLASEE
jgi:NAD(P)H-hydrate epimerase